MKKLSEKALEKIGQDTMKDHKLETVYVTEDGQSFKNKSLASSHASKNEMKVFTFSSVTPETNEEIVKALEMANEEKETLKEELKTEKASVVTLSEENEALKDNAIADADTIIAKDLEIGDLKKQLEAPAAKK